MLIRVRLRRVLNVQNDLDVVNGRRLLTVTATTQGVAQLVLRSQVQDVAAIVSAQRTIGILFARQIDLRTCSTATLAVRIAFRARRAEKVLVWTAAVAAAVVDVRSVFVLANGIAGDRIHVAECGGLIRRQRQILHQGR